MGRLLASIWWLSRRQGGPDTCPCCLIAAARKAVIPPAQGQRLLAAQTLHSLSLVRALTSLRCRACGSGPVRTAPAEASPFPLPPPAKRFLSPCIFPAAPRQMHQSFQGWQREENAKGPGAGTTQTLLPGSPKHRQPAFPAGSLPADEFTWDRQRPRTCQRGCWGSRTRHRMQRGISSNHLQGFSLLLWDLVSTCADNTAYWPPLPTLRRPECGSGVTESSQ